MNADLMPSRVLALAGILLALKEVRHLAENGRVNQTHLSTAIDSVFRLDADSTVDVYGSIAALHEGLRSLRDYLQGAMPDQQLPRLALSVLQLERNFERNAESIDKVRQEISRLTPLAHNEGSTHPDVLRELGSLYSKALSPLRPKVMVQGNPHYLGRSDVVTEIRALLLAAVRSAMLWRQMGGTQWDFVFQRSAMKHAVADLLSAA
ncbi:lysogenization regulator HflD [Lysobacteraceae bacterium NML120232]|nr:lysogenization regulator HflD [Xanthomonadaceae bacterium NML120232]PJK10939.1 lysogenization regulator HflD [Xanthomonadaceae bacterium NML08-0793]